MICFSALVICREYQDDGATEETGSVEEYPEDELEVEAVGRREAELEEQTLDDDDAELGRSEAGYELETGEDDEEEVEELLAVVFDVDDLELLTEIWRILNPETCHRLKIITAVSSGLSCSVEQYTSSKIYKICQMEGICNVSPEDF